MPNNLIDGLLAFVYLTMLAAFLVVGIRRVFFPKRIDLEGALTQLRLIKLVMLGMLSVVVVVEAALAIFSSDPAARTEHLIVGFVIAPVGLCIMYAIVGCPCHCYLSSCLLHMYRAKIRIPSAELARRVDVVLRRLKFFYAPLLRVRGVSLAKLKEAVFP